MSVDLWDAVVVYAVGARKRRAQSWTRDLPWESAAAAAEADVKRVRAAGHQVLRVQLSPSWGTR